MGESRSVPPGYFVVAEPDHDLQNPLTREKLLVLGERIRLRPDTPVLDVASGRGGPAIVLHAFGCRIHGIEIEPEFHEDSVARATEAGEPFWRAPPLPDDYEHGNEPFTTLEVTVGVFESGGLRVVTVSAASDDDWDRYETLHWRAVEEWLAASPDDPRAAEVRSMHERSRRRYLRHGRGHLGWAVFVAWTPG